MLSHTRNYFPRNSTVLIKSWFKYEKHISDMFKEFPINHKIIAFTISK